MEEFEIHYNLFIFTKVPEFNFNTIHRYVFPMWILAPMQQPDAEGNPLVNSFQKINFPIITIELKSILKRFIADESYM